MSFLGLFGKKKQQAQTPAGSQRTTQDNAAPAAPSAEKQYPVFLPKTTFPMKANLPKKEPEILAYWNEYGLYKRLREQAKATPKKKFILHYGPPYANGAIHTGHALTECLKDILVRTYQMAGYDAPLVPGWDCHGLPIEWKVEESYRKQKKSKDNVGQIEFIGECRKFAAHWMDVQKTGFQRLGICANWEEPYCTMDPASEGAIVEQFLKLFMKGGIYRGKKPVMWSVVEKTALAEAEVEYQEHESTAVYVAFPITKASSHQIAGASAVIWTTTPWTLPANRAVAYHKDLLYAVVRVEKIKEGVEATVRPGQKFLVAKELCSAFCEAVGITESVVEHELRGDSLRGTFCRHPLAEADKGYQFEVPLLHAPHVTLDAGTGLVHIAPSHGQEDFLVGKEYNLEMPELVLENGCYAESVALFAGEHIFKIDDQMLAALRAGGTLLNAQAFTHSYPHSWRSKSPLIFRLTKQWFLDIRDLRSRALDAIDRVRWFPEQSRRRIRGMVEARPDWCLSRQRVWGVPIALLIHKKTGEPLRDEETNQRIVAAIREGGIEAWHTHDADFFLPPQQSGQYEKVMDTLDVWFDSACTHEFVLRAREDLRWPADLYLEGSDQHRGWFQSSLIEAVATGNTEPYRNVVTHGFILDQDGRKMSKSLGNVIACDDVIARYGADLLRLWVITADWSDDIKLGQEILQRQEDLYRRYRNTLRYLLGALNGYTDAEEVPYEQLPELERYVLHLMSELSTLHHGCMANFNMSPFYSALHLFCANELSAFYFDIRKDVLYCDKSESMRRRATRTVLHHVFENIVRWLAPLLSFTAEEAWQHSSGHDGRSIHEQTLLPTPKEWTDQQLAEKWQKVKQLRRVVLSAIEQERLAKTLTSSLQADVTLFLTPEYACIAESVEMQDVVIVSKFSAVTAKPQANAVLSEEVPDIGAVVTRVGGVKCPRCWKFTPSSRADCLCTRCTDALE